MLANFINSNSASLPDELRDLSLNARHVYMPPFKVPDVEKKIGNLTLTYALQLHISVVEVDPDTYQTRILDYAIVDDCGKVINPMIVEGQVHGAAAHGIGAALVEDISYDADGNAIAGSFTDYAPITISTMPELKCSNRQSPSPFTFHGAKGMGEGGGGPLHSLCAALQDALHGRDIIIENSHNSPMSMFQALFRRIPERRHQSKPADIKVSPAGRPFGTDWIPAFAGHDHEIRLVIPAHAVNPVIYRSRRDIL